MATMKRLASGEKHKESETSATVVATSPRGGEKRKRTRRAVADTASTEEIKEALGGFSVAGPSTQPDPVTQVLDWRLGEVIAAIDHNTRELVRLGGKMDGFALSRPVLRRSYLLGGQGVRAQSSGKTKRLRSIVVLPEG